MKPELTKVTYPQEISKEWSLRLGLPPGPHSPGHASPAGS